MANSLLLKARLFTPKSKVRSQRPITDDDVELFAAFVGRDINVEQVAHAYGISKGIAYNRMTQLGFKLFKYGHVTPPTKLSKTVFND